VSRRFILGELELVCDGFTLHFCGSSRARTPYAQIEPVFRMMLEAAKPGRSTVTLDFSRCDHLNSPAIGALVQLLNLGTQEDIPLRVVYQSALRWQAISFEALQRAIAPFGGQRVRFEPK
jgi:hypothetical protein